MKTKIEYLDASFRDPSGFLFTCGGNLYRQVNQVYAREYDRLVSSGLYQKLVGQGRLIPHTEVDLEPAAPGAYKILLPERLPFISYPYEWSFGQLKTAALTTLSIQKRALSFGMSLKDASAYNIQFHLGKAALIDTLSFELYQEGEPWTAYRQFCQHFLAPLALMSYRDIRLGQLLRVHLDGIPLDLASRLLPSRTYLHTGLATHIHLHARAQQKFSETSIDSMRHGRKISPGSLSGLIEHLRTTIQRLEWKPPATEWGDYYAHVNYSDQAFEHKKSLVSEWADRLRPALVWDLGANMGVFSRQVSGTNNYVIAWDLDPGAVERNWEQVQADKQKNILPLILDLTNPSPSIGWDNRERDSIGRRGPADMLLALALIHHLAISNNLPFERIAPTLAGWGRYLLIEFVPKSDPQVQKLFRSRRDIFPRYDQENFEGAFSQHFQVLEARQLHDSLRRLYLMQSRLVSPG